MNKKIVKVGLGLAALTASVSLVACGGDSSSSAPTNTKPSSSASEVPSEEDENTVESYDDLPDCTKKHVDDIFTVSEEETDYICSAEQKDWVEVVSSVKALPDCGKKTDGDVFYVSKTEEYVVCEDGEWISTEDEEESSSSDAVSSSSEEEKIESSSSVEEKDESSSSVKEEEKGDESSSSAKDEDVKTETVVKIDTIAGTVIKTDTLVLHQTIVIKDTAYVTIEVPKKDEDGNDVVVKELVATAPVKPLVGEPACTNAMFCGKRGDIQVETTVGKDNYGWWYTYTDDADGGTTKITWPHGFDEYDSFVWPSVYATAGLKAKVSFGKGTKYPYAGLGFDLVDAKDTPADISSWGGMCVIYNTAQPLYLQVKPTNEAATTGYNNPMAVLPSTNSKNSIIDIDWSFFQQEEGWGEEVSTASVLKKASKITFKLAGNAGTDNTFIIYAIGKKGTCEGGSAVVEPVVEAVDVFAGKGDFWNGTGKFSYFDTYFENYDEESDYGAIEVKKNDDGFEVLQFYTNYGVASDDDKYFVQLSKDFTLEKGYSYQIEVSGYDWYNDATDPEAYEILHIGIQNPSTYANYIDNDGSVWTTDHNDWVSGTYKHCKANATAKFYINGASDKDKTGLHIQSIKLLKTPASC